MTTLVYVLCALTSVVCAVLLWRGWRRSGVKLLFWSALCFVGLSLNNLLLVIDSRFLTTVDLALLRMLPALVGAAVLVYGLVWDAE
jgi:hypothetical protein